MSKLQTTEGGFRVLQRGVGLRQGQQAAGLLELFIGPLGGWLDNRLGRRLVHTFFLALVPMVRLRHNRVVSLFANANSAYLRNRELKPFPITDAPVVRRSVRRSADF